MTLFETLKSLNSPSPSLHNKIISNQNLSIDFSKSLMPNAVFDAFQEWSNTHSLTAQLNSLFSENAANIFENQSVNFHQLRSGSPSFYTEQLNNLQTFVTNLNNQKISDLKPIKTVVQIGIGGSHLGPESIVHGLNSYCTEHNISPDRHALFISNIDPIESKLKLSNLDPEHTLFLLVSKSGSTIEMESNYTLLKAWWLSQGKPLHKLASHCIAITMPNTPLDHDDIATTRFYIDSAINGRFSVTSIVGACIIALCFGIDTCFSLLKGARAMDLAACNPSLSDNCALAGALEMVWQASCNHYPSRIIAAYSYALRLLPHHIQQLSCESNGKSITKDQKTVTYPTCPIIITAEGSNAQHSFFQLLHQGTSIIPVEFITISSITPSTEEEEKAHSTLLANALGQSHALFQGATDPAPYKTIPGKKPSIHIKLDSLTPESLGNLISYYENKTVFEGIIWNINSFDQPGVQLGKQIALSYLNS